MGIMSLFALLKWDKDDRKPQEVITVINANNASDLAMKRYW